MIQYILVEHQNDLNEQIQKPIQESQRIKFTSFDVTKNYIVFGASSGGIYIYKRKPCVFLKIVPTKEGIVDKLSISSDECFMAVSNPKGSIIIIENCFTGQDVKFQIYNHHDNNKITVLKWHLHELYSGDINGKVCVTTLKSALSKSIFQIPFTTLMHLDSSIVQIDGYLQYLLISTLTKTLFCDTAHEQYKQIGKKLRDGPHGACFQNIPEKMLDLQFNYRQLTNPCEVKDKANDIVIFCSRPGLRLWQVDFNSSVVCTHQFKNAKPFEKYLFKITDESNSRAIKHNINVTTENDSTTNFCRMLLLKCNLMLTFNDNVLYILRVTDGKVTLLFKLLFSTCIVDIRIVHNDFYILLDSLELKSYSIYDLENFISFTLNAEQYLLCADICVNFKKNICELLKHSENLQIISALKFNLEENEECKLIDELKHFFEFINCRYKMPPEETKEVVITQNQLTEKIHIHPSSDDEIVEHNKFDDEEFCVSVIIKQYMLNVQYHVVYPDYAEFLKLKPIHEIMRTFENIRNEKSASDIDHNDLIAWCSKQFLSLVTNNITVVSNDRVLQDYTIKCFTYVNNNPDKRCKKCKYPLPTAKDTIPNYYQLFCDIFKEDVVILSKMVTEIPYMWKCMLEYEVKLEPIKKLLPIIIQFSDITVLEQYSHMLNYDLWDEAVNLMIKIKSKRCLYCDTELDIDVSSTLTWQSFANVAMRIMGPTIVLKLFKNYAGFISNTELGPEFYQNLIFVAAMDNAGKDRRMSTRIFKSAISDRLQKVEMESSLTKYLNNAFTSRNDHSHLDISPISSLKNILSNKL